MLTVREKMRTSNDNKCRHSADRGNSRSHLAWQSVLVAGMFLITAQGQALAQAISYTEDFTTTLFDDPATTVLSSYPQPQGHRCNL
jgi:hypothetical protein